jgi:hypothetical protein
MKVTRDVISDLWALCESGEATADTQALVEEYLASDPDFATSLRENGQALLGQAPSLPPDLEARTLTRTRRKLIGRSWPLFFAMMFSMLAFGRIVSDTSFDVSPRPFIATAAIAIGFWITFFVRLFWFQSRVLGKAASKGSREKR